MSETQRTEIGTLGEFGLIDRITRDLPVYHNETLLGPGDDAAILAHGADVQLISTDMMLEGIHFDLAYHPLKHLGYKAVITNLSDVCAMNGIPEQILVSVGISNRFSVEAVEELYEGIRTACETYAVDLIGGDTCSSNKGLVISITVIGRAPADRVVKRSGAKPGDLICITGDLGAAYLGLQILEREKQIYMAHPDTQPDLEGQDYVIGRQLKPEARLDMVKRFYSEQLQPTAMIDISDGLSSDLMHICKSSGTGARIEEAKIPMSDESEMLAIKFQLDPVTCALHGGEDYELLFTADPADLDKLRVMEGIYIIGEIMPAADGLHLQTAEGKLVPLRAQGWAHFNQG